MVKKGKGKRKIKTETKILIVALIVLFIINYPFFDNLLKNFLDESQPAFVERVIDGDTIDIGNSTVRLLGINTPERGEIYYSEAKEFLEREISNKNVTLGFSKERYDRYDRILAYVFFGNRNINLELIENGFANYYFPSGKDRYYDEFADAWRNCINNNVNLCEASTNSCASCVELKKLDAKNDKIVLYNGCSFQCDLTDWIIKDEGRKKFVFPRFLLNNGGEVSIVNGSKTDTSSLLYWRNESYILTETGDTIFLRDSFGKLVLWKSY
ncbi:MAG: thermonuclease family protein [Nanoarchaeota archaeon]